MSIDLEMKSCCGLVPVKASEDGYYPTFHYSGDKELELPDEGTMTIRFKKVSSEERKANGKEFYSCTIEVCEITSVDGEEPEEGKDEDVEPPAKSGSEAADALDEILKSLEELKKSDAEVHKKLD